jgi:hypothetical protein
MTVIHNMSPHKEPGEKKEPHGSAGGPPNCLHHKNENQKSFFFEFLPKAFQKPTNALKNNNKFHVIAILII